MQSDQQSFCLLPQYLPGVVPSWRWGEWGAPWEQPLEPQWAVWGAWPQTTPPLEPQPEPQPQLQTPLQPQAQPCKHQKSKPVIGNKPGAKKVHDEAKENLAKKGSLLERYPSQKAEQIMKRDQENAAAFDKLPKRKQIIQRGRFLANARNQGVADSESQSYQEIDNVKKPPPSIFSTDQSAWQYWAAWMAMAKDMLPTISQNAQPDWTRGEIFALDWDTVDYAGEDVTGQIYVLLEWHRPFTSGGGGIPLIGVSFPTHHPSLKG